MLARLIAIAALLLMNGFFVAAEFALVRSRRTRLESMARTGDWKARLALRASGNLAPVLSAIQLGVTLASLALGALAESAFGERLAAWLETLPLTLDVSVRVGIAAAVAVTIVTFFHVVFGELAPRGAALSHPENVARWLTPPLLGWAWLVTPLTALLNRSAQLVLRAFRQRAANAEENVHSPEELRMLVEQSQEVGVLQAQDADMLEGVFEFSEKNAREVMTPRTDIDALPIDATLDETLALVEESGRSRYPVYEESIDNIIGLVLAKDLIPILRSPPAEFSLRSIMRPVHVVPGNTNIGELNERFGLSVPDDDYTTIGGYVFGALGRLPMVGDRMTAGGAVFTVRAMDGRRVDSLAVDLHSAGDRRGAKRVVEG